MAEPTSLNAIDAAAAVAQTAAPSRETYAEYMTRAMSGQQAGPVRVGPYAGPLSPNMPIPQQRDTRSSKQRRLARAAAKAGDTILYEAPADRPAIVMGIWICSSHNNSVAIRLHHTEPGESPAVSNALLYGYSLAANTTVLYSQIQVMMQPGDRLWIRAATADVVSFTVYGIEP